MFQTYRVLLVTSVTISVTVDKSLSEVLRVHLSITKSRTVASICIPKIFFIAILETVTVVTVLTAFLDAFVIASVQSTLTHLLITTVVAIVVVVAAIAVITPIALGLALATSLLAFPFTLTPDLIPLPLRIAILRLHCRARCHSDTKKER